MMRILSLSASVSAIALTLAACGGSPAAGGGNTPATVDAGGGAAPAATGDGAAISANAEATPTPVDTADPATDADADPGTAEAAVAVVRHYYDAIDRGDFRTAYELWGNDGEASGQSFVQFRDGFASTARSDVTVGTPGRAEGAAGSIYIEIPVTVDAELKDGTNQHFSGSYTLRRVNDVPGSTAEQRRWHLSDADLKKE
ncbi:hypothetical protein [Stakelama saccharophila]|uniref:Lipoprotein n=1 Tax=Stakelama saccharophila TaxID=3075605 RepID=A0ABZ0B6B7_9SPHN|nr:hypothetical protein [Stakelama sp. W311]WNO52787.1 hypothetical protein RPR59_09980 [Stakelama sp. W311]